MSINYQTRDERAHQAELTTATLCDMVLGEDATDRSDKKLIRAVDALLRVVNAARGDAEPTIRKHRAEKRASFGCADSSRDDKEQNKHGYTI